MAGPLSEYVAAAILLAARSSKVGLPQDWAQLEGLLASEYGIRVESKFLRSGIEKLKEWEFATVLDDYYAGEMIRLSGVASDGLLLKIDSAVFRRAQLGGPDWLRKVFGNDGFWRDLDGEINGDATSRPIGGGDKAPASDRIVTFSDNQVQELDIATTEIIDAVAAQNQVDNTAGLRELVLGQLKAGRELIRAGSFKLYFVQLTLIDTLSFLAKRYEKEAIGALAASLIAALMRHIGIDT